MKKLAFALCVTGLLAPISARADATVHLQAANFRFCALGDPVCTDSPFITTVAVGATIDWTYEDRACDALQSCGHDIRIEGAEGGAIQNDGSDPLNPMHPVLYTRTFTTAGVFHYWCSAHKPFGMIGTVIVN